MAVTGALLPTLIFVLWMNYLDSLLDHPDMDDWYLGNGRTYLHICQIVIASLEVIAFAFGVRACRKVLGKIVFFMVAAALYFAY